ncbi:hypothetical protein GCM10011490_08050 [Pseudoclavibacter endophyticus]|uniref:SRPBCC family protein n=1 Tax=Pseudoclavibacter endophyticus TaxID=1778590 RepID=UPI001668532C|nr:SRPBCC family protein [Pseudoclavibacter endophyticus]GGA60262.1 hypothetical protein GCM10011490_08050 [Pseudoclavibacter endophyticus]
MIRNVHERALAVSAESVGALIDSLGSTGDRLWPGDQWPRLRLDRPIGAGAAGGHGPVRYFVEGHDPGRSVIFRFTRPVGFRGRHSFSVASTAKDSCVLRHELEMTVHGAARVTWPLFYRPLHDALLEESLDRASASTGTAFSAARRSWWVRLLRAPWSCGRGDPEVATMRGRPDCLAQARLGVTRAAGRGIR